MYNVKHLKEIICFAGGLVFGTAGVKILASKDAKNAYIHTIAAGLRMKESVMETVNKVQENAEDVLAAAKDINEKRAEADAANLVEAEDALNNGKEE